VARSHALKAAASSVAFVSRSALTLRSASIALALMLAAWLPANWFSESRALRCDPLRSQTRRPPP
jgi:hypothetical protein